MKRDVQIIENGGFTLVKKEITVLLTEQNARLAFSISERGYIIDKGRVRCAGETRELVN